MERILFVVNGHQYTAEHRLPVMHGALEEGYEVVAVAPEGSASRDRIRKAGFDVYEISLSRRGVNVWRELRTIHQLTKLYGSLRPDLVHHATIKPVLYGSLAAKRAGVPAVVNAITGLGYVYTAQDFRARLIRKAVNALYLQAFRHPNHRVIFQNSDDCQELSVMASLSASRVVVIPGSGVDTVHAK